VCGVLHQLASGIEDQGVAAIEDLQRRHLCQARPGALPAGTAHQQEPAHGCSQRGSVGIDLAGNRNELATHIEVPNAGSGYVQAAAMLAKQPVLSTYEAIDQVIYALLAAGERVVDAREGSVLRPFC